MAQGRDGSLRLSRTALSSAPLFPFSGAFQDSLPAASQALPGGAGYPLGSSAEFQSSLHLILPAQASPVAHKLVHGVSVSSPMRRFGTTAPYVGRNASLFGCNSAARRLVDAGHSTGHAGSCGAGSRGGAPGEKARRLSTTKENSLPCGSGFSAEAETLSLWLRLRRAVNVWIFHSQCSMLFLTCNPARSNWIDVTWCFRLSATPARGHYRWQRSTGIAYLAQ